MVVHLHCTEQVRYIHAKLPTALCLATSVQYLTYSLASESLDGDEAWRHDERPVERCRVDEVCFGGETSNGDVQDINWRALRLSVALGAKCANSSTFPRGRAGLGWAGFGERPTQVTP